MYKYLIVVFIPLLMGCKNSFEVEDLYINISGLIINESTGKPIKDINVTLQVYTGEGWGGGGSYVAASSRTADNGKYQLSYKGNNDNNGIYIYVNDNPYNEEYSNKYFLVFNGKSYLETKIYQNTTLKVSLNSKVHLNPGTFTLWFPGGGTSDTVAITLRAKGNFYNTVRLNYSIDDKPYEVIDSVFCPIDTVTNFVLNY